MKTSHSGFSLVEVIIVTAILGILAVGATNFITSITKQQKGLQAKDQQRAITNEIRTLLTDKMACLSTFGSNNPTTPRPAPDSAGFSVTAIKNSAGVDQYTVGTNDKTGLIRFDRFNVINFQPDAGFPNRGNVELRVSVSKVDDTQTVKELRPDIITLKIRRDGVGNIAECYSIGSQADGLWQISTADPNNIYYNTGRVGIGTDQPSAFLEIRSSQNNKISSQISNDDLGANATSQYELAVGPLGGPNSVTGTFGANGPAAPAWGSIGPKDVYLFGSEDLRVGALSGDLRFFVGNPPVERMTIGTNGYVGIGTNSPDRPLEISDNNIDVLLGLLNPGSATTTRYPQIQLYNHMGATNDGSPTISMINARGTLTAKAPVQAFDSLGGISFWGSFSNGGGISIGATIRANAAQNFSFNNYGSDLVFATVSNGTQWVTDRMKISNSGNVGIDNANPAARLDVNGEVKVGNTGLACTASTAGALKYTGVMQYCNGTSWINM